MLSLSGETFAQGSVVPVLRFPPPRRHTCSLSYAPRTNGIGGTLKPRALLKCGKQVTSHPGTREKTAAFAHPRTRPADFLCPANIRGTLTGHPPPNPKTEAGAVPRAVPRRPRAVPHRPPPPPPPTALTSVSTWKRCATAPASSCSSVASTTPRSGRSFWSCAKAHSRLVT